MDELAGSNRRPRADAVRNRERLVQTAKAAFAEAGPDVGLEEVARRAGVGIGTLYRHFPTRDALVEAVYRQEIDRLADAAPELLADGPAIAALEKWLLGYARLIATKRGLKEVVATVFDPCADVYAHYRERTLSAATLLIEAAARAGAIRDDVDPEDVLLAVAASTWAITESGNDWEERGRRLLRLTLDGLRYRPTSPSED